MSTHHVTLMNAEGVELALNVEARNDSQASDRALSEAESRHPGQGWMVLLVL